MRCSSEQTSQRRQANARGLAAFGLAPAGAEANAHLRTVREGNGITVYTIGYQGRDGEECIALLREVGVDALADVREKPMSRKPDFRAKLLKARCEDAGILYSPWPELGSPKEERLALQETGDIEGFHRRFRAYARRHLTDPLDRLAELAKTRLVALLCYERAHTDCHRSDVAAFLADRLDATVVAIL